jgi:hypothetical protein
MSKDINNIPEGDETPEENQNEQNSENDNASDKKKKDDKKSDDKKKKDDKKSDDKKKKDDMSKEPIKGKGRALPKKEFSLDNFKEANGLNDSVKDKDLEWIPLSEAFQKASGLKGIPKGYVSLARGYSNTGKSTTLLEAMVSCQKLGILPVFIDTENHFNWQHARDMGLEFEEVWDEETGECINYKGFFIYVDGNFLVDKVGSKRFKGRDVPSIEDIATLMNQYLDKQKAGELPYELCFLWDSIGSIDCDKSIESSSGNNMWNAGALEAAFKSLINFRIPSSKKEGKEYTNTFVAVQKIWLDSMQGAGVIKHKGGEAYFYASRLILHFGGIQSHGTKKLYATAGGREYQWGTQAKFDVAKNQVNSVSYKGELISTAFGFIEATKESIDNFKKVNKDYLLKMLDVSSDVEIGIKEVEVVSTKEEGDL